MDRLLSFLLYYLPFQIALSPFFDIDLASSRVLILIIFFLWLAKGLKDRKINIKNNWQNALVLFFLFFCLLSIARARNYDWALRKALFIFSIFPIYFVASDRWRNVKFIKAMKAIVISASALSLVAAVQFVTQFFWGIDKTRQVLADNIAPLFLGSSFSKAVIENSSWLVNIGGKTFFRAVAVFPDPHMLAFYLNLVLFLPLAIFLKKKKKIYLFSFLILFVGSLLTFSRGGYVGLFFGVVAFLLVFLKNIKSKYKVVILVALVAIIALTFSSNLVHQRVASIFDLNEGSNSGRIETWSKAVKIIEENPLGVGIGNYPLEVKATAQYREPIYAHNTYMDIAAELGILSAIVWLCLLGVNLYCFFKKAGNEVVFAGLFAGLATFMAHSFFDTAIFSPTVLTLFLIIISFNNLSIKDEDTK